MERTITFTFRGSVPVRLDRLIEDRLQEDSDYAVFSRSQLKGWIEEGRVSVAGKVIAKAGSLVKDGAEVTIHAPSPSPSPLVHYDRDLSILFEDEYVIVVDKPSGLTMHPGAGEKTKTLANVLVGRLPQLKDMPKGAGDIRPGIVHRLDKDTTGVVVVAKTLKSHTALSAQFAARSTGRAYKALVFSSPRGKKAVNLSEVGTVDAPLGRDPHHRTLVAVVKEGGKRAVTHWRVIEHLTFAKLLEVRLETGRTHQIRVHMNSIGSPVIGDQSYGDFDGLPSHLSRAADKFGRQALHAASLEFDHPETGRRMRFDSDLPQDFLDLLKIFREDSAA